MILLLIVSDCHLAIASACFTVLVSNTITSTQTVTDTPIVSRISNTTASTTLPGRIITYITDQIYNTVTLPQTTPNNQSTEGDNSNLCNNGSTIAAAGSEPYMHSDIVSPTRVSSNRPSFVA